MSGSCSGPEVGLEEIGPDTCHSAAIGPTTSLRSPSSLNLTRVMSIPYDSGCGSAALVEGEPCRRLLQCGKSNALSDLGRRVDRVAVTTLDFLDHGERCSARGRSFLSEPAEV